MTVEVFRGSILDVKADLIVNPANSFLRHDGGLAGVIDRAATAPTSDPYLSGRVTSYMYWHPGLIATGDARLGPPGALATKFKGIIHAVGPIWSGGGRYEPQLLRAAYKTAFSIAADKGWSVAAPAISAGIFGVPIDIVAHEAAQAAKHYANDIDITFALVDPYHVAVFDGALRA